MFLMIAITITWYKTKDPKRHERRVILVLGRYVEFMHVYLFPIKKMVI